MPRRVVATSTATTPPRALELAAARGRHAHTSRTLADFTGGSGSVERLAESARGLSGHLLPRLLECAGVVAAASREDALLDGILEGVIAGLALENAAFIRPTADAAVVEVVAVRSRGDRAESFRFSRSLIAAASGGDVAILNPTVASHSIDALGIVAALCAPVAVDATIVGYIYADRRKGGTHIHDEAGGFLDAVAKMAGLGLGNLRRRSVEARQADLERELIAAQEAQRYLLPPPTGSVGGVEYAMLSRPGRLLSGDLFSVMMRDGRSPVQGDVSGGHRCRGVRARPVSAVLARPATWSRPSPTRTYVSRTPRPGDSSRLGGHSDPGNDAAWSMRATAWWRCPRRIIPRVLRVEGGPPLGLTATTRSGRRASRPGRGWCCSPTG